LPEPDPPGCRFGIGRGFGAGFGFGARFDAGLEVGAGFGFGRRAPLPLVLDLAFIFAVPFDLAFDVATLGMTSPAGPVFLGAGI